MKYIDIGVVAFLVVILVGGSFIGIASLLGWTFVHDKLRFERKQDEKENKRRK